MRDSFGGEQKICPKCGHEMLTGGTPEAGHCCFACGHIEGQSPDFLMASHRAAEESINQFLEWHREFEPLILAELATLPRESQHLEDLHSILLASLPKTINQDLTELRQELESDCATLTPDIVGEWIDVMRVIEEDSFIPANVSLPKSVAHLNLFSIRSSVLEAAWRKLAANAAANDETEQAPQSWPKTESFLSRRGDKELAIEVVACWQHVLAKLSAHERSLLREHIRGLIPIGATPAEPEKRSIASIIRKICKFYAFG